MDDKVKPDGEMHERTMLTFTPEEGAFFLRSTILRVIDEEVTTWENEGAEHYGERNALRILRARFEEVDDG